MYALHHGWIVDNHGKGDDMEETSAPAGSRYGSADALRRFAKAMFVARGLADEAAAIVADNLLHADLRGHASHGVTRIPIYLERLDRGVVNARPDIRVTRTRPGVALVDGDNGMGAVVADLAMKQAIGLAAETGVGIASIRASNHNGPASFFAMQALEQGCIGVSSTNSPVSMAVWGSRGRALGTNPIALAVPAGRHASIVADMSSSVVARGKIVEAAKRGDPIPPGWALDAEGRPTTDPKAAEAGVVLPFAGPKGSALAVLVDVLCGVLSGAAFGRLVSNLYADFSNPQNNGQFMMAIDVAGFMPPEDFRRRVDDLVDMLKATPRAAGVEEILMPGEPEARSAAQRTRAGIPLPANVIEDLRKAAEAAGVAMPPLTAGPLA
jgi:LDH2 family malate/lactate/ureidoglycolate dehydrogenase